MQNFVKIALISAGITLSCGITAKADDGLFTPAINLVNKAKEVYEKIHADKQEQFFQSKEVQSVCNWDKGTGGVDANLPLTYSQLTQIMKLYGTDSDEVKGIALEEAAVIAHADQCEHY